MDPAAPKPKPGHDRPDRPGVIAQYHQNLVDAGN
jgi:hypothetical protein